MTIKVGSQHAAANREYTVTYMMSVLRQANDWQEGQDAAANHPTIGPWLRFYYADDVLPAIQSIIREAEQRLGDALPY